LCLLVDGVCTLDLIVRFIEELMDIANFGNDISK